MLHELRAFPDVQRDASRDGTFYCLPDFRAYGEDSEELSRFLLDKALVVTVPGKEFGAEGHLRLCYCGSVEGDHRGRQADPLGARPGGAERDLHRRPPHGEGLAMSYQPARTSRRPRRPGGGARRADFGLANHGLTNLRCAYWNLPPEALYEEIAFRARGPDHARRRRSSSTTGKHTSRAAADKFVVREPSSEEHVWWGEYNRPISAEKFDELLRPHAGLPAGARPLRPGLLRRRATPSTGCRSASSPSTPGTACSPATMFVAARTRDELPPATCPSSRSSARPSFKAWEPADGTRTATFIVLDFAAALCVIGGTELRRRDQEVGLHAAQLPAAARGRAVDALLGQRRRRRRRGALLRALRHRQDDAVRRPVARPRSATTSTAGRTTASSTSRTAATRR